MHLKTEQETSSLTPRKIQLLKLIHYFHESRCYSPTLEELASSLGISRSTVFEHIAELRRKDLLSACPGRARSLTLTSKARELLDKSCLSFDEDFTRTEADAIPLCGRVAAGLPIEAIENTDYISLKSEFGSKCDVFALEVKGNSMIDEDIRDGDFVICRKAATASNGQLVTAIVDENNATLKRFYKEVDHARLQPANKEFNPIYSDNCRIEAVVVGLIRKL
ncbi:MAG: transcriptional repressor LexA [Planctomycetota bacterium]